MAALRTGTRDRIRPAAHLAGVLLVLAGAATLMGITTAEALYPDVYTTHANTISDLGASRGAAGAAQPSAAIFNVVMIVTGMMQVAAAAMLYRAFGSWVAALPVALIGAGSAGVGVFPSDYQVAHVGFAAMVFIAGGVAGIATARVQQGPFRLVSIALGVVALSGTAAVALGEATSAFGDLGDGGIERWAAYPIIIWTIAFGAYLTGAAVPESLSARSA